jgi:hypothetical protein
MVMINDETQWNDDASNFYGTIQNALNFAESIQCLEGKKTWKQPIKVY